jgi:hypothetical protein
MLEGESDRLTQVVTNLLSNAIKYSPNGGAIEVQTRSEGRLVTLTVRDHGIGIATEQLKKIFDRYSRIEADIKGMGLGLAIVSQIVQLHHGTVWGDQRSGRRFRVSCAAPVDGVGNSRPDNHTASISAFIRRNVRPMRRGHVFARVLLALMTASACLPLARAPATSTPASPTQSASSSPAPSSSLIPAGPSASPSPTAASVSDIHVTAVAAMPADPHFFSVGGQDSTRILLFDSSATRPAGRGRALRSRTRAEP